MSEKQEKGRSVRKGEREKDGKKEKMNRLCSRAIFSTSVMCSISLRWYNREKRAVKEGDRWTRRIELKIKGRKW